MSLRIDSSRVGTMKPAEKKLPVASGTAFVPVRAASVPAFSQPAAHSLRSQVMFGSSYEPQHSKLTYSQLETLNDPILGKIDVYQFSNGMKFYGLQRDDVPLVSFGEVINTGSLNEKAKENGVSHFLEHLIFKGSKHLAPGEFSRRMENLGGGVNAFTYYAQTFYYTYDLPKDKLMDAMKLRAEFIQNVNLPPEELKKERTTVVGEIKRADDEPSTSFWQAIFDTAWGDSPLRRPILGPSKIIETISRDAILDCYYRFYAPENRAIIMVGDFDMKQALDGVASEYNVPFPQKSARGNRKKLKPVYPPNQRDVTIRRDVSSASVAKVFDGPQGKSASVKNSVALDMAATILGSGGSSRLYRRLVEDTSLAHSAGAFFFETKGRSLFAVSATAEPDKTAEVTRIFREELEKIAANGVTPDEIAKALEQIDGTITNNVQKQIDLTGDLAIAVSNLHMNQSFGTRLAEAEKITSADIQQAVRDFLSDDKAHNVTMLPQEGGAKKAAAGSSAPSGVRFSGALTSKEASRKLSNGIEVLTREKANARRNAITVAMQGGDALQSVPGEARILSMLMSRATGLTNNRDFQERLDAKGIKLNVSSSNETFQIAVDGKAANNQDILDVVGEMLQSGPSFNQEDFDKVMFLRRKGLEDTLANEPTYHSLALLWQQLFPNHPYGTNILTNLENLDKVTLDGVKALYKKMVQPQNMTISMAGTTSVDTLAQAAEGWTRNLKNEGPAAKEIVFPEIKPVIANKIVTAGIKDEDEMKLSEIYRGWHATGYRDEDRAAAKVMNTILSAGLSSRLFRNFREGEHGGLCYSVYSDLQEFEKSGVFNFYIGTAHQNLPLVLEMFQKEVDQLMTTLPTEEEMESAKNRLESIMHSADQTVQGLANSFGHRIYGTDNKWDRLAKIKQVTPEQVQAFARKYLSKPSVTAIAAPATILEKNNLPVNGEKILDAGKTI